MTGEGQGKLEPIAHYSPREEGHGNLDNDLERFIASLVRSPGGPDTRKKTTVTPDRSLSKSKKRRLFRDRPVAALVALRGCSATSAAVDRAAEEILVPLKDGCDDDHHLDGIRMTFSGINENEIVREFSSDGAAARGDGVRQDEQLLPRLGVHRRAGPFRLGAGDVGAHGVELGRLVERPPGRLHDDAPLVLQQQDAGGDELPAGVTGQRVDAALGRAHGFPARPQ